MAARPLIGLVSLILVASAVLLQFFIILSGAYSSSTPLSHTYFLQATTAGIPSARNPSRWTYFSICGADANGLNTNCGATIPALPFYPPGKSNFGTTVNVPTQFVGTRYYYYLSRFAWVFYLLALFFGGIAVLTGLLALCTRLGSYLSALNTFIALGFQTLAASLMTAWTVKARNAFNASGQRATLGRYAYGFSWGSVALLFLSTILFCVGGRAGRDNRRDPSSASTRGGLFGRKRSVRSRGSFIDSERSVGKAEYN